MPLERDQLLIKDLLAAQVGERDWFEFKRENHAAETIGKLVSAISNSARLCGKRSGYVVWGISDDGDLVGTEWDFSTARHGNQGLEIWLTQRVQNCPLLSFRAVAVDDVRLVLLEIPAASVAPVEFERTPYVRIGDATPRLSDHPERLMRLVELIRPFRWEHGLAQEFLTGDDVLRLLDYSAFFRLIEQPLPDNRAGIFERLEADKLVQSDVGDRWAITNLGAVLFASDISLFDESISRRAVRFVKYDGRNRAANVVSRQDGRRGYANGFENLVTFISNLIPTNEEIGVAFRQENPMLPSLAIRELVANALIHQDMTVVGAGPLIELFEDRLEITNPGNPLVDPSRMIDLPPQSRNEILASLMRRMKLCEEQGSGLDKVIQEVERFQLSPPEFRAEGGATKVVLFGAKSYADMSNDERVRACYQHAVIKYVTGQRMRNMTLCERLGIEKQNTAQASGVINRALVAGLIKAVEEGNPKAGYVPSWA